MRRFRIVITLGIAALLAVCAGLVGAGGMGPTKWIPVAARSGGGSNSGQRWQNRAAFAALKLDGSVVTWGDAANGGDSSSPTGGTLTSGVTQIASSGWAFAALKNDGSVVTWGQASLGGDSTGATGGTLTSGVTQIVSTGYAFAALKNDGSVVTWGHAANGGNSTGATGGTLTSGVTRIFSDDVAFAALKADGSVVTWGDPVWGGDNTGAIGGTLTSGVTQIFSTHYAFAALKNDGSVVTWGNPSFGGDSTGATGGTLTSGVTQIASTAYAFAALKSDGSVVTWGHPSFGGDGSSPTGGTLASGVAQLFSSAFAFAALKLDGSVVTWGNAANGGDSSSPIGGTLASGVETIASPLFRPVYLPGAPSQVTVAQPAPGERTAAVSFRAPESDGGTTVTGYRATCVSSTGGAEAEAVTVPTDPLRIEVGGLTPGATYTCAVVARNLVGEGQPSAASGAFVIAAPAASPSSSPAAVVGSPLKSVMTCRRTVCVTRGPVPPKATAVTQNATAAPSAWASEMATSGGAKAKGRCHITKVGKGTKATRTYQCTIRLSKGKWRVTTRALAKSAVIAQAVSTRTLK